ncbi:hypothetical protein Zm00014a_025504 [Zea mays]|uniref:Uncharacterized protein n=1 Tax=Zea mays TaxID=4577 RepID=A0A3L6FRH9_MAIZE|nr:hypothetical protein Zm00014a_025504 [Zea mays]
MAAAPSPRPRMAHRKGGAAPISLFLDTDLGTHLALLIAPDTDIRGLKPQVAAEHAAAFPDIGPVITKSFQVRRKGVLYRLSDSMTVMSSFTKIEGGCFLHVNMAEATEATYCCQDAPAIDDKRLSDVSLGIHVKNHIEELPVMASDVACDLLPRDLEGGNDDATLNNVQAHDALPNCTLVPSSSQLNTEILKNKAVGMDSDAEAGIDQVIDKAKSYSGQIKHANKTEGTYISSTSMACVDKSSNESNMSHAVAELHASRDHGVGDDVSDKKQVRVEQQLLEEIQSKDTLSQVKEHKKSRTGSFDASCTSLLKTGTTLVESLNTSNHQEVHETFNVESIQLENPSTVGKKKKRKRRQLSPSKSASAQETIEPSATAVDLLKPTGEGLPHNSLGIQIHNILAMDNLSQENEHKKSRTSSPDTSSRHLLETDPASLREPLNTSNHQVHDTLHQESIQLENPSAAGKKKKRKRQLAPSKSVSTQITTEPSPGAAPADLSRSTGDEAYNVELNGKDETIVKESGCRLSSSELNDANQGGKSVQFVSDALASIDLICKQEKFGHSLKGCKDPSIANAIYSTSENVAIEGKTTKESCVPLDRGDKHEEKKQHNEGCHNEAVPEISHMEKGGKSTDVSNKRHTNQITSQVKKGKKSKVGSVGMPTVDATGEKDHMYSENAAKQEQDTVSTKKEIAHEPSVQQMSNIVYQGDSNVVENPSGDGKKKKKRRRHSESLKGMNPSQDLTSSSGFVTNKNSIQCTYAAPIDAKQTTQGIIEGETVTEHMKLSRSLDVAATNIVDEVLADLRPKDSLSKDLDEDLLPGQTHLGSNQNGLEVPESIAVKVGSVTAALPPKCPAAVHFASPVSSPRQKKSKGKKSKVLSTMTDSSHQSSGVSEEDANRELTESDSLRFADKTSDPEDIVTGNVVAQADDKRKTTKRQRKKGSVKQVCDTLALKETNDAEENLVQGGYVVDTPLSTVGEVEQKGKSSQILTPKIRKTNCSTHGLDSHTTKDNQGVYVTDIIETHDNENAAGTPTLHEVQKYAMVLKSANPNSQKQRKTSSNSELQSQDCALEHGFTADLVNSRTEREVSTTSSASAVKPDYRTVFHRANDGINFLDHFRCSNMNDDPSIAAESKQNNEDEPLREMKNKKKKWKQGTSSIEPNDILESFPSEKASLTGHFGTSKAIVSSVAKESMNIENENVNDGKEKKRKGKANMEVPTAEKDNSNCDNQGIDISTQESLISFVQNERTGQDNGKESNSKVTRNASIMQHGPEDPTWNHTPEKNLHQSVDDDQNKLLTEKDHAHISKEVGKFTSQPKHHAKIRKPDEFTIKGKVAPNPKPVSNLMKDFSMSPGASSDSTEGMPQSANRYKVSVQKVPSKMYQVTSGNSKKASRKIGSGAISNDSIREGCGDELDTTTVMEGSSDSSSTSADSGISSTAYDESEASDDDGAISLSQKSLKGGLHISSILRGSRSYKKARKKLEELLDDDDTIVPDSQPTDGLRG